MKVLLDTSLLLPTLGVEVKGAERLLERLRGCEIYYSEVSVLEAVWIAISLIKKGVFNHELFELGLRSIFENYRRIELSPDVVLDALKLYELGRRDVVDCMLYAVAMHNDMKFASLDEDLKNS